MHFHVVLQFNIKEKQFIIISQTNIFNVTCYSKATGNINNIKDIKDPRPSPLELSDNVNVLFVINLLLEIKKQFNKIKDIKDPCPIPWSYQTTLMSSL